jgi:hypothetical protein
MFPFYDMWNYFVLPHCKYQWERRTRDCVIIPVLSIFPHKFNWNGKLIGNLIFIFSLWEVPIGPLCIIQSRRARDWLILLRSWISCSVVLCNFVCKSYIMYYIYNENWYYFNSGRLHWSSWETWSDQIYEFYSTKTCSISCTLLVYYKKTDL